MVKYGLEVKTWKSAGQFQHHVYEIRVSSNDVSGRVSNYVVSMMKKANEALWEEMPRGSGDLISTITYETRPKGKEK